MLKSGGTFCGCFYVAGECKQSDWFVRHIYEKTGFFTPPYETVSSLKARLEGMYTDVDSGKSEKHGMVCLPESRITGTKLPFIRK